MSAGQQLPTEALQHQQLLDCFAQSGYCVVPNVLTQAEVAQARRLLAAHRSAHAGASWSSPPGFPGKTFPGRYGPDSENGRWQTSGLFTHDSSFDLLLDRLLTSEPLAGVVRDIVGPDLCLRSGGMWAMWRMPVHESPPLPEERGEFQSPWPVESGIHYQMWHREQSGLCLPGHPLHVHSLQVKLELDDCDSSCHCISTVPESVTEKKQLPLEDDAKGSRRSHPVYGPERMTFKDFEYWRNTERLPNAVDISCAAGSAIVFNNHNYHAGTVRQTTRHRRSFGFDYGHASLCTPEGNTPARGTIECERRLIERYPSLLGYLAPGTQATGAKM